MPAFACPADHCYLLCQLLPNGLQFGAVVGCRLVQRAVVFGFNEGGVLKKEWKVCRRIQSPGIQMLNSRVDLTFGLVENSECRRDVAQLNKVQSVRYSLIDGTYNFNFRSMAFLRESKSNGPL